MCEENSAIVVVQVGVVGAGKSSLGNALLGFRAMDNEVPFEVGVSGFSVTKLTEAVDGYFKGDPEAGKIRVIDTPGHGDGAGQDSSYRQQMVERLKTENDHIDVILWVINAEKPRIDSQDAELFGLLNDAFGPKFLRNLVINFSHFPHGQMHEQQRNRQSKTFENLKENITQFILEFSNGRNDDTLVTEVRKFLSKPRFFTVDVLFDDEEKRETDAFNKEMNLLWKEMQSMPAAFPVEQLTYVGGNEERIEKERTARREAEQNTAQAKEALENQRIAADQKLRQKEDEESLRRQMAEDEAKRLSDQANEAMEKVERVRIESQQKNEEMLLANERQLARIERERKKIAKESFEKMLSGIAEQRKLVRQKISKSLDEELFDCVQRICTEMNRIV